MCFNVFWCKKSFFGVAEAEDVADVNKMTNITSLKWSWCKRWKKYVKNMHTLRPRLAHEASKNGSDSFWHLQSIELGKRVLWPQIGHCVHHHCDDDRRREDWGDSWVVYCPTHLICWYYCNFFCLPFSFAATKRQTNLHCLLFPHMNSNLITFSNSQDIF